MGRHSFAEQGRRIEKQLAGLPEKVAQLWAALDVPAIASKLSRETGFHITCRMVWNAWQQSKRK